jgi:GDP-L-fucose synthase
MKSSDLIYVAGHEGLIGSAIVRTLQSSGYNNLLLRTHQELELTNTLLVDQFFDKYKPKYVFLAAGKVGGIVENKTYPADFIRTNLNIQLNVMNAAQKNNINKLIFFGSSCMYPRECKQPMAEDILLSGQPEPTSIAYAIAKLAGLQMCLAYNKQFNEQRFIPVIPNSAYGPHDNFDPNSGHVLSALITRFHKAKSEGTKSVTLWGSGNPRREFIHADDIAKASLWLMENDTKNIPLPINIGVDYDVSIKELALTIADIVGYEGVIEWDLSKPDGTPRKLLDSSRMRSLGWKPEIDFKDGLKETYNWYLKHAAI